MAKKRAKVNTQKTVKRQPRRQTIPDKTQPGDFFVIDDNASLGTMLRAKRSLMEFFDDSVHKHHPGQEHLAYFPDDEWP
jgi:hypothetical protein